MDTELYAMKQLQRRIVGWRVTVLFCFLSIGAHFGWILYLAIDAKFGALAPGITAKLMLVFQLLAGFVPPLVLFGFIGFRLGRSLIEKRLPSWIDQLSTQLGVDRNALDAFAAPYRSTQATPPEDSSLADLENL